MNISEKEKKYVSGLRKNVKYLYMNYITIGILLCGTIAGFLFGFKEHKTDLISAGCFFLALAVFMIRNAIHTKISFGLIENLLNYIEQLESK